MNYYVAFSFSASYEPSFNLPFAPGDVAFFEASSRNGLIGCTVELRDITTGLAINTNGLWKCTTTPPSFPSVLSSSYDDSSWSPATILDTNNPNSTSSLFMANIHVGLDR